MKIIRPDDSDHFFIMDTWATGLNHGIIYSLYRIMYRYFKICTTYSLTQCLRCKKGSGWTVAHIPITPRDRGRGGGMQMEILSNAVLTACDKWVDRVPPSK